MDILKILKLENISEESKDLIEKEFKVIKFSIGQPISFDDNINKDILFIVDGEARLLDKKDNKNITFRNS